MPSSIIPRSTDFSSLQILHSYIPFPRCLIPGSLKSFRFFCLPSFARDRYTKRAREQEEKINSGQSENQGYEAWIRSGFSIDSIDFRIIYVRNCVFCKENFWKFSFFFWKNWRDEKKYAYLLCTFECRLNIKSMKIIDARNEMERFYFENREEMKFKIPKSKHIDIFLSLQYIMWSIIQGKWDWNEANIVIFIESFTSIQPFSSRKQKLESTFHPFA